MIYKNIVTGAIIDSPCIISGGDWRQILETQEAKDTEIVEDTEVVEDTESKKGAKKTTGKK